VALDGTRHIPYSGDCLIQRRHDHVLATLLVFAAVNKLMILPVSAPLWKALGMLQSNIFVWRLVYPLSLVVTLMVALVAQAAPARTQRIYRHATLLALALVVYAGLFMLGHTYRYINTDSAAIAQTIEAVRVPFRSPEDPWGVNEYLPNPAALPAWVLGWLVAAYRARRPRRDRRT